MPVNLTAPEALAAVPGIRLGTASLGVRKEPRHDLCVMEIAAGATTAAGFTRNAFCAAPVTVARDHLNQSSPRYLVINAGNANAGTGRDGDHAARTICAQVAALGQCDANQVLPFSTGVIGELLATSPFEQALPEAFSHLDEDQWLAAGAAIMTTDIVVKGVSKQYQVDGHDYVMTGITKGSGMICPDMATMLAFIATDAPVSADVLQECLDQAIGKSFNCVTVDGDTSTNDACVLVATGASGGERIESTTGQAYMSFSQALTEVSQQLAQAIIRDGEGATKFITIDVSAGANVDECRQVAYTVAHSPLVKTALFASDANWGRILAAVGRSGLDGLVVDELKIFLDDVLIVENGGRAGSYEEQAGASVLARDEFTIGIKLGRGDASAQVWTCDLSHGYVTINADYRS